MQLLKKRGKRSRRGFHLVEALMGASIFALATTVFFALYPTATRGSRLVESYSQAVSAVQHKADQLRAVGYGSTDYTQLRNTELIDASPNVAPYHFEGVDGLAAALNGAVGEISITDFDANLRRADIRLTWSDGPGSPRTRSHAVTILIAKPQ